MNHKLTIRFAGICTNFRYGVAAGVPHRVVLPDASRFITELLTIGDASLPEPVVYYLLPHFAQLEVAGARVALDVPPLVEGGGAVMKDGDIFSGIRLQVINAVEREMTCADNGPYRLAEFVPHYTFSTDVVLSGRAMCYFDLYGGKVFSRPVPGGALQTFVELTTDGPPELLVTPLASLHSPVRSFRLPLGDGADITLDVKNLEAENQQESRFDHQGGAFDFLLHYLTAKGGIPQSIQNFTPGLGPQNLVSTTPEGLARVFEGLAAILRGGTRRKLLVPDGVTQSCSASSYP